MNPRRQNRVRLLDKPSGGVITEAKPVWAYPVELGILGVWTVVTSVVAIRVFKFS